MFYTWFNQVEWDFEKVPYPGRRFPTLEQARMDARCNYWLYPPHPACTPESKSILLCEVDGEKIRVVTTVSFKKL